MSPIPSSTTFAVPETLINGAVRKAKNRLVPMIIIMYLIAYIDRANLGFAALRMNADLNLTPDLFGFAAGIFYVGYVIFEVPSNVLLGRFGCNVWFARIMVTWGLLSMATGPQSRCRLPINHSISAGLCRGRASSRPDLLHDDLVPKTGAFQGDILLLSWAAALFDYRRTAFRSDPRSYEWLFRSQELAMAFHYRRDSGADHRGRLLSFYLTNTPKEAKWLTDEEREAYDRMMEEERKKIASHGHADLEASLLSSKVWILGFAYCATVFGLTGLVFWMPQIIKQFKVTDTMVGLLSTIPYIIGAIVMCWWAARSDAKKERFWHFIVPSLVFSAGFVLTACSTSPWASLLGMVISTAAFLSAVPVYYTLPASFLVGAASAGGMADL